MLFNKTDPSDELYLWFVDVNKEALYILQVLTNIRVLGLVEGHHRQTNNNRLVFHRIGIPKSNKKQILL